jgi:hypothetical protein
MRILGIVFAASLATTALVLAQRRGGGYGGGEIPVDEDVRTARAVGTRTVFEPPIWTNPPAFAHDVFTFARVRYDKSPTNARYYRHEGWTTDLPDADINLPFRLQQITSMRVDADGRLIRLTDPELPNYPFLFISAPGSLFLTEEECKALRSHLLNGGFLLMDDFWGDSEWENCEEVMKGVFPERKFFEVPLDHPLYRGVFHIKEKLQVPNIQLGRASERNGGIVSGEPGHDGDVDTVHHRGICDDKGRLMVLALHNMDTADGWEREGESDFYFHNFSEKIAFPLGINIIYYVMTH